MSRACNLLGICMHDKLQIKTKDVVAKICIFRGGQIAIVVASYWQTTALGTQK